MYYVCLLVLVIVGLLLLTIPNYLIYKIVKEQDKIVYIGKKVTDQFYLEILALGGWHSDFIPKIQNEDQSLSTAINSSCWKE